MNRSRKEQMRMFFFMCVEVVSDRIAMDRLNYINISITFLTYIYNKIKTINTQKPIKEGMIRINIYFWFY